MKKPIIEEKTNITFYFGTLTFILTNMKQNCTSFKVKAQIQPTTYLKCFIAYMVLIITGGGGGNTTTVKIARDNALFVKKK